MLKRIEEHTNHLASIREKLKELAANVNFDIHAGNLSGACAISAYITFHYFNKVGFSPIIYTTDIHCWIQIDDYIIDLTATQFDVKDEVFIAHTSELQRKLIGNSFLLMIYNHKEVSKFINMDAFQNALVKWRNHQNPFYMKRNNQMMKQILAEYV